MGEVHFLNNAQDPRPAFAQFPERNYALFEPDHPAHTEILNYKGIRAEARTLGEAREQPTPGARPTASGPEMVWPQEASFLLDASILRLVEAFVGHLGTEARIVNGEVFIGGSGSNVSLERGRALISVLAVLISAVVESDGGCDPGGPFGGVGWDSDTGKVVVGKNQVVPSCDAGAHGEVAAIRLGWAQGFVPNQIATSGETCAMCAETCAALVDENGNPPTILFVATTQDIETNTPFIEGPKEWDAYLKQGGTVHGPEEYTDETGKVVVEKEDYLAELRDLACKILRAFTTRGEAYAV